MLNQLPFRVAVVLLAACSFGRASDLPDNLQPSATIDAKDLQTPGVNPTATATRPSTDAIVSKSELLGHIQYLASPHFRGREAGTPDQIEAAKYIAGEFKRYGLPPFGDDRDGVKSYFQDFSLRFPKKLGVECELKMSSNGKDAAFEVKKDFVPFPCGKEKAQAKGEVAFAGYGIVAPEYSYDDFKDLDVAGKWVLVLRYEPQEFDEKSKFAGKMHTKHAGLASKVVNATMRRAIGVMIVTGPAGRDKEPNLGNGTAPTIGDFEVPVLQITRAAADRILSSKGRTIAALQAAIDRDLSCESFSVPDVQVSATSHVEHTNAVTSNVLAMLPGSDEKLRDEWVVLGAHCDHLGVNADGSLEKDPKGKIHYGADDNASGTAGLLEVAQYYGSLEPEKRPKRSLLFMAFTGEEKGLLGAEHYLKNPKAPLKDTIAMLNMDMIGRAPGASAQVAGIGTAKGFRELVEKYAGDPALKITLAGSGSGPSDHAAFYAKNIPVLFFFTGLHDDYHRSTDTWDRINAPVAEAVAELARKLLADIANLDKRPEFVKTGGGGYIGVSPDNTKIKTTKGYPVGAVVKDSPADKAGIKAGDIITAINSRPQNNAHDMPMTLIDFTAGDEIEVTLDRAGTKVDVKLKLGKR